MATSASTISTAANGAAAANATVELFAWNSRAERGQARRQQHLGRREIAEHEGEHEHPGGRQPRAGQRHVTRHSVRSGPRPSDRADSSSDGSISPIVLRSATTANGTNRIASASTSSSDACRRGSAATWLAP